MLFHWALLGRENLNIIPCEILESRVHLQALWIPFFELIQIFESHGVIEYNPFKISCLRNILSCKMIYKIQKFGH